MNEWFPIAMGAAVGLILGYATGRLRVMAGIVLSVVLGICATVATGEWRISWAFLLIDIPLVAVSAVITDLLGRRLRSVTSRHAEG